MINALNSSVSGLLAQSTKIQAGALNIASADIGGGLHPDDVNQAYKALDVNITSTSVGSVQAKILPRDPATVIAYDPDSQFADKNGLISAPNVNRGEELINNLEAAQAYKASLQIIPLAKDMHEALLSALDKKA